jgi:hypothetical protein
MICAHPGEGEKSPQDKGVEYADNWPVAHHTVLQEDFYKNAPKPPENVVVRQISAAANYRRKPPADYFEE